MSEPTNPSRDLLFGLLALQNGLIDQGALFMAFAAWTRDKSRSLADHLIALGSLDPDDRAAVEALADRHLKKHGGAIEKSLAVLAVGRSTQESLARIGGPDVEATLGQVGSAHPSTPDDDDDPDRTGTYSVGSATSEGQRFRIIRPHAKGGLGAVFVALDSELDREVALKQILDDQADDPTSRFRFLIEAQITGGLEHPGIVPVYGLGAHSDGRPYYAMRFIRGDSLKEAIDHFHAGSPTGSRELALRRLLRRFMDVCNAIEYSHSRGVIHRDIKPANIILGRHGETLVVDWGLAKPMGRVERGTESGERLLMPSAASGSSETLPGSALGTPAYMSPEQAEGQLDRLGPQSDVYSLGATLYCLLTGKPPYAGDVVDVIRGVQNGEFRPPRQLDPSIDPPLEAICLRAMARRPNDRYASSRALADDLDRWMADEPVTAWREPFSRRARRWAQRNRTAVTSLAASGLVALAGCAAVLTVQAQANGRLQKANNALEVANRRVTEANAQLSSANEREKARFNLAMDAIKLFHGEVSEDLMMKEKKFDALRTKLLKGAADFYGRLEDLLKGQTDRESRAALGKAYVELSELTGKIGDQTAALAVHRKALAVHRALASEPGADIGIKLELARGLTASGWLQRSTGDMAGALKSFEQSRSLAEEVGTNPELAEQAQGVLGTSYSMTGNVLADTGDPAGARAAYDKALAIRKTLADGNAGDKNFQRDLATAHNSIGLLKSRTGDPSGALLAYREALPIQQKLADANPGVTEFQQDLSWTQMSIGLVLSETGDPVGARAAYEKSLGIRERLVNDNPTVTTFQDDLANGYINLGSLLSRTGDAPGARAAYGKAIAIRRKLSDANPRVIHLRQELARSFNYLGNLLAATGDLDGARAAYRQALAIEQKQADANPNVIEFQRDVATSHNNIGALLSQTGEPAAARDSFGQALAIQQRLADANPNMAEFQRDVATSHSNIGAMLSRMGDLAGALAGSGKALTIQQKLADANPSVTAFQIELARSHYNIGIMLSQTGDPAGAQAAHRRALAIQQKLADANPRVTEFQQGLASTHENIGILLSAMGDGPGAGHAHGIALIIRQKLAGANSSVPEFQADVARSLTDLGMLRLKSGEPGEAIDYFSREEAIWKRLADTNPLIPNYKDSLANCQTNGATVLLRLGRLTEARAHCMHAVALREALASADPNNPQHRKNLAESLLRFGQVRRAEGDLIGASADWTRAVTLFKSVPLLDGEYIFYYASCHASLSTLAGVAGTSVSVGEKDAEADRAMALLRRAVATGYRNPNAYRIETALYRFAPGPTFGY